MSHCDGDEGNDIEDESLIPESVSGQLWKTNQPVGGGTSPMAKSMMRESNGGPQGIFEYGKCGSG